MEARNKRDRWYTFTTITHSTLYCQAENTDGIVYKTKRITQSASDGHQFDYLNSSFLTKEQQQDKQTLHKIVNAIENKGYQLFEKGSVEKLFKRYDTDGSGQLDYGEFSRALNDVGVNLEPREFARVIHHIDANRDGQVDFKEFVDMIKDERGEMMRAPHMATHLKGGGILPLKGIDARAKGKKMYYDPHLSNPLGGHRRSSMLDHKIVNVSTGKRPELYVCLICSSFALCCLSQDSTY